MEADTAFEIVKVTDANSVCANFDGEDVLCVYEKHVRYEQLQELCKYFY